MLKAIASKRELEKTDFYNCVFDLIDDSDICRLKDFTHHKTTTRFQHSVNVSYYSWRWCRRFRLDAKSAARGAMMHDLFFYNRKEYEREKGEQFHNARHPKIALLNASERFDLDLIEADSILSHMFPLTIHPPKYRESALVCCADKYCAMLELISGIKKRKKVPRPG